MGSLVFIASDFFLTGMKGIEGMMTIYKSLSSLSSLLEFIFPIRVIRIPYYF